jgi:dephospho-CoA kinase
VSGVPGRPGGRRRTVRIGLTGPIGCGKSTIGRWLGEVGAVVVDADDIARRVTDLGESALDSVVARFGEAYRRPDGSLDRAALGRLVFSDQAALRDLEAIVHPAVRPRIEAAVAGAEAAGAPAVVIEAIKLIEAGYAAECDEVWLVTCDVDAQRRRLVGRGSPAAEAEQRIASQGDLAARLGPLSTRVIDTSGGREATRRLVTAAWEAALDASPG